MLLPGIHWEWLRVCFVWALFIFLVFYILKQIMVEEEVGLND